MPPKGRGGKKWRGTDGPGGSRRMKHWARGGDETFAGPREGEGDSDSDGGGGGGDELARSRREFPVKLFMWDFGQCDAKRCTGRKLSRLGAWGALAVPCVAVLSGAWRRAGYVKTISVGTPFQGLVLSPAGEKAVSVEDRVRRPPLHPARLA